MPISSIHYCKVCGSAGHQSSRSKFCLVRKENFFEVGALVALSLPSFNEKKAEMLRNVLQPGYRNGVSWNDERRRVHRFYSMENRHSMFRVPFYFSHEPVGTEKCRTNVNAARILSYKKNMYQVRLVVRYIDYSQHYRESLTEVVVLNVPVFFEGKRLLFPLKSRRWELPKSMIAECRAYYNRGHAKICGKAKVPKFEDTSWRKGETAKDKEIAWRSSLTYAKECLQEKKLMRKMCLLPDEIFREVMEFA